MNDSLRSTLDTLLRSGGDSNPALNELLRDYAEYHVVFIVLGGLFLLAFVGLTRFSWRRFRTAPRSEDRRWSFERATFLCCAAMGVVFTLMMMVIVAANASSVADPRHGFSGGLAMIGTPPAGTRTAELHQAFTTWLQSGETERPALVDATIEDRLAWQRPKAIICSILLVVLVLLSAHIWRTLIRRSRADHARWTPKGTGLLAAGLLGGAACLLLMLMVIGNTQASFAPVSMTLFYG